MLRGILDILAVFLAVSVFPQQCLTHQLSAVRSWQQRPAAFSIKSSSVTIPVVVHVVWNTPSENIPDATIMTMIDQLNNDFNKLNADTINVRPVFTNLIANAEIDFCLATSDPAGNVTTGITRTFTNDDWFDPMSEADDMKAPPDGIAPWDPTSYLNVWISDISSGTGANIVNGYTYLPQTGVHGTTVDGIVLDYDNGLGPTFRTITHEVGHYLGLQHTWGNGGCADDDGIADTPNTDGETTTCSNDTLMRCNELTQYENFMDFSPCRAMFTTQQSVRMDSILTNVRGSLLNSDGCDVGMFVNHRSNAEMFFTQTIDQITINGMAADRSAQLIDMLGREVHRAKAASQALIISTSDLVSGMYIVRVPASSGGKPLTGKLHIR